jgi:hypothetical protein
VAGLVQQLPEPDAGPAQLLPEPEEEEEPQLPAGGVLGKCQSSRKTSSRNVKRCLG